MMMSLLVVEETICSSRCL